MTYVSDPTATYNYTYDALGRATSISQSFPYLTPSVVFSQGFDANGNRTSLSATIGGTADFANTYTFDKLNRMTRVQQTGQTGGNAVATKRVDFAYDAASRPQTIKRYADTAATKLAVQTTYTFDNASRLLKAGEISAAEFMKLVYDDVQVHPGEIKAEYEVRLEREAVAAPFVYLVKIAMKSLKADHAAKLQAFQEDIERLEDKEKKAAKTKEMLDYILTADPWAQAKAKKLQDPEGMAALSAEQHVAFYEEIEARAKQLSIGLADEEKKAMAENLAFWRGRHEGSKTMAGHAAQAAGPD